MSHLVLLVLAKLDDAEMIVQGDWRAIQVEEAEAVGWDRIPTCMVVQRGKCIKYEHLNTEEKETIH